MKKIRNYSQVATTQNSFLMFQTASVLKDVYLPKITKQPKEVWKFTKQVFTTIKGPICFVAAAQVIAAMGVTYLEQECYFNTILPVLDGKVSFVKPPVKEKS
jgi:hypothetical protein